MQCIGLYLPEKGVESTYGHIMFVNYFGNLRYAVVNSSLIENRDEVTTSAIVVELSVVVTFHASDGDFLIIFNA